MLRQWMALGLAAVLGESATVERWAGGGAGSIGAGRSELKMNEPFGVAFDAAGNAYVVEYHGNRVVRIGRAGETALVAGTGQAGFSGDGGRAASAALNEPHGVVISRDQQLYIADTHNNRVRRVDLRTGGIATVAGNGQAGFSGDGGPATEAAFKGIFAIDLDPRSRVLYITDLSNRRIRAVNLKSGIVTTVAGNGERGEPTDGALAAASPLVDPRASAADGKGNVYVLDRGGNALRVVDRAGRIRTLVGKSDGAPPLNGPKHLCLDRNGDVLIADDLNHMIRRYSVRDRRLETVAGTGKKGTHIDAGNPLATELNRPHGVSVHPRTGDVYVSDSSNHRVLRLVR